jgi:hypothetical protein
LASNVLDVNTNTAFAQISPGTTEGNYVTVWINCFDNP